MLIGILSDIHDHLENLKLALTHFEEVGAEAVIFCGDFCSPIPLRMLGEFNGDVHCVFGNGDGDRFAMSNYAAETENIFLHGEHAELELNGCKIAVTHYPFYGSALARTGDYDLVCSGHTHEAHTKKIGKAIWLNPGEVLGFKGKPTAAAYDTLSSKVIIFELEK